MKENVLLELRVLDTFGFSSLFLGDLFIRTMMIIKVLIESTVTAANMLMIIVHFCFVPDNEWKVIVSQLFKKICSDFNEISGIRSNKSTSMSCFTFDRSMYLYFLLLVMYAYSSS